jgi:putative MATE family efflux protein
MTQVKTISENKLSKFISLTKQALQGTEQDYTEGSIRRAVFLLSVPMILEMIMESIFALVDLFFVNRLGVHATSTVGLTESVLTLIYSIAIGLSAGVTAMVARRIGEKNPEGAAKVAAQALILSLGITIIISIIGYILAADILRWMGAEPEAVKMGTNYARIMFGCCAVIILLFLINGIFRGAGDASVAMRSLWLANICNIILCPILINGLGPIPAFGLTGAAIATTIGRGTGVVYQLYHLFKGKRMIKLQWHHFGIDKKLIINLLNIGYPATIQFIIASASWIFLAAMVATGGSNASAGYQTAIRIIMFFILPAWGLSNAAATLVGQNLGAKQPDRAEQSVIKAAQYNAIFMAFATVIFLFGAPWLIGFFTPAHETEQIRYAVSAMRYISAAYIFYGIGMVMTQAFNGAGDTRTPTLISIFGFWVFQIPLAYLLVYNAEWGPFGVFIAIPIAETFISIAGYILFRQGKWKEVSI